MTPRCYGVLLKWGITPPPGLAANSELQRVIDAARSPNWSIGEGRAGQVMATKDSGTIGQPWAVTAERAGGGMRVSLYRPGDDVSVEGEIIGQLSGNPREQGRQLRGILEELDASDGE